MPFNLVLASGSPRRRELLLDAGYEFRVIVPDESVEAAISPDLSPHDFVVEASYQKAKSVATVLVEAIVVAADTIAVCHDQAIGKPRDRKHAREILLRLQGNRHFVLTGLTVWNCCSNEHVTHVESTELVMRKIDNGRLDDYLDSDQWIGKAGAFGYQDDLDWVQIVRGSESNVVGLPIEKLPEMFHQISGWH